MKRIVIIIMMHLIFLTKLSAPTSCMLMLIKVAPLQLNYDDLIEAIYFVESSFNPYAFNQKENAHGGLQIRKIRLDDYNKKTGKNYQIKDLYNIEISKEIFLFYARKLKDYETISKKWNGSGPLTEKYWEKVKTYLETKKLK